MDELIQPRIELLNGNCLELLRKMEPECIDLLVTDPPYRTISGGDSGNRPKGMLSGNRHLFEHQNDIEIYQWMPLLYKVLKENSHAYVFTNFLNLHDMLYEAKIAGFKLHNLLVWEKNNCTPSQFYMKNCEYILFMRKGKSKWINNIGGSKTVHQFNNIIGNKTHPCEKPIDLLKFYIENSSKEGDIVLDPFMGTGSCGIACMETNRNFIGIELDQKYYDVAKKRVEEAQGRLSQEVPKVASN